MTLIYSINDEKEIHKEGERKDLALNKLFEKSSLKKPQVKRIMNKMAEVAKKRILDNQILWLPTHKVVLQIKVKSDLKKASRTSATNVRFVVFDKVFTILDDDFIQEVSEEICKEVLKLHEDYSCENVKKTLRQYQMFVEEFKTSKWTPPFYKLTRQFIEKDRLIGVPTKFIREDLPPVKKISFFNKSNQSTRKVDINLGDYYIGLRRIDPQLLLV